MGHAVDPARLGRRALLTGAGGLFLSGCSGGSGGGSATKPTASPTPSGPIVHEQDAGTVITQADIDELLGRMDAAVRHADAAALKAVAPKVHEPIWQQRLDNLSRFPLDEIGFVLDDSVGRQVNASGGRVETDVYIALTHRISGVDSRPVVQIYGATLLKTGPDAPVRVVDMDDHPDDEGSSAAWDLDDWDAVESKHVVVAARREDIGQVRANLAPAGRHATGDRAVAPRRVRPLRNGNMNYAMFHLGPVSADGSMVYASLSEGPSGDLLGIDLESGEILARWALDDEQQAGLVNAPLMAVDGLDVVLARNRTAEGNPDLIDRHKRLGPANDLGLLRFPEIDG